MVLVVTMAFFAEIPHRLKTLIKAVLCIATISLAFRMINMYHNKPVRLLRRNITTETQTSGVAGHVNKNAMMECADNMFTSPNGCLPCPNGTFSFRGWSECKTFLNCSEIAFQVHLKQKEFGGITKQKWIAEWMGHKVVYMNCSRRAEGIKKRCLRGMTRMETFQGPFVTRLIGRCYDRLQTVTMIYKHGSGKTINQYLQQPQFSQYNSIQTRFQLVVDYVKVMNYLHNSPVGTIVMCDTANLRKALSQYLITDDFHLVVNDLDNTPLVGEANGILCGHKTATASNLWFSPEQRGLYESDSTPKTDEKIEIWRIPVVMRYLLGDVNGSSFVKSKLEKVMRRCQATNSQQRPTANEVVQEFLRVQQLITDIEFESAAIPKEPEGPE